MVKKYKEKYWHPLVILEEVEHKNQMKEVCAEKKTSIAKTLGGFISGYIKEHKKTDKTEGKDYYQRI